MNPMKSGQLIDIETARLKRWERKQADQFKTVDQVNVVWVCVCGCWQYELRPIGAFCVSCGTKQSVSIKL
jgi:hypothetical protein